MTTSSDELAEIRTILKQTAQQQQQNTVALSELRRSIAQTQLVTESNARSIAAMQSQIDESFALHERVVQMALEDQQQWREQRRHLIERYGQMTDEQDDARQSIQNLLEDARADRQANEKEHQAFREIVRSLLAEIARIWQRLAN